MKSPLLYKGAEPSDKKSFFDQCYKTIYENIEDYFNIKLEHSKVHSHQKVFVFVVNFKMPPEIKQIQNILIEKGF